MKVSPLAGKPAEASMLVNVPRLVTAYYTELPDPSVPAQRVAFGTSGHRGSAFDKAFNEWHILAISQAICLMGRDPGEIYRDLTREFGEPVYDLVEAPATSEQKEILERLSPEQVRSTDLAGEKIQAILTTAPGNSAPIGGLKVSTESGWFAARPSGTEDIYKIYAESFQGADHLRRIVEEAQVIVNNALAAGVSPGDSSRKT
jgi:phosphoglucomutase